MWYCNTYAPIARHSPAWETSKLVFNLLLRWSKEIKIFFIQIIGWQIHLHVHWSTQFFLGQALSVLVKLFTAIPPQCSKVARFQHWVVLFPHSLPQRWSSIPTVTQKHCLCIHHQVVLVTLLCSETILWLIFDLLKIGVKGRGPKCHHEASSAGTDFLYLWNFMDLSVNIYLKNILNYQIFLVLRVKHVKPKLGNPILWTSISK